MKPLFLVTSAIHTNHGKFSTAERFAQTIQTLESIRIKVPEASIFLLESSATSSISEEEANTLKPFLNGLLNYHDDTHIQEIYKSAGNNWDVLKTATEINVFIKTLDFIVRQQPQLLKDVDRIFKLSGRYYLNDNFDLAIHLNHPDNYIFATRRNSQFPNHITGGLTMQLMTRLWSFPASKTALMFYRYNLMLEDFMGSIGQKKYRDLEHLILKYVEGPYLTEIEKIGVSGTLGPNGINVED